MKARVFVTRNGKSFKVATIEYRKKDASIYLFIPNRLGTKGRRGITEITGQQFRINIADLSEEAEFDHFSVHGSGVEHSRLKQGEVITRSKWTPLKGLDRARHLWTLVLPDITDLDSEAADGVRDLRIDYPSTMTGGVIDFIATPQGQNINFNAEYTESNDRPTLHTFSQAVWDVDDYRVFVYSRSSDKHTGSPPRTLKIALPEDYVPLVTMITPTYVEGMVATLVYDKPNPTT